MQVVELGAKNENPSTADYGTAPPRGSRRPRLRRDVFRTQGGGVVGEVQAGKPPGIIFTPYTGLVGILHADSKLAVGYSNHKAVAAVVTDYPTEPGGEVSL